MFAVAKCGHCNGTSTRVAEISPTGAAYKQTAICCSSCNAILGVSGYYDTGQLLQNQKQELAKISQEISRLQQQVRNVEHYLSQR